MRQTLASVDRRACGVVAEQTSTVPGPAVGQRQPQAGPRLLRNRSDEARRRSAAQHSTTGWAIGYTIGIIVVLVVVALVVPILLLAHSIGNEAERHQRLAQAGRAQHGRAQAADHHDRPRARSSSPGSTAAAPGWEADHDPALLGVELTSTQRDLWWGAIIGGFVVVLAVAALLTILVVLVRTIDRRVVRSGTPCARRPPTPRTPR